MEKVCPWYGQPSDQVRLKNRTVFIMEAVLAKGAVMLCGWEGNRRPGGK